MAGYQLSEAAAQDLEDIYLFGFFTFGENQADFYAEILKKAFTLLVDNPLLGHMDKRLKPADSVHRFEHGSHIIFYLAQARQILIIRIMHKSMDVARHI